MLEKLLQRNFIVPIKKVNSDSLKGVETTKSRQNIQNRFQLNVKKTFNRQLGFEISQKVYLRFAPLSPLK